MVEEHLTVCKRQADVLFLMAKHMGARSIDEFLGFVLEDGIEHYLRIFRRDHPRLYRRMMKEWPRVG